MSYNKVEGNQGRCDCGDSPSAAMAAVNATTLMSVGGKPGAAGVPGGSGDALCMMASPLQFCSSRGQAEVKPEGEVGPEISASKCLLFTFTSKYCTTFLVGRCPTQLFHRKARTSEDCCCLCWRARSTLLCPICPFLSCTILLRQSRNESDIVIG